MRAVKVPASSANLGCAFDCAAVALDLHLSVTATRLDRPGLRVSYRPRPDFSPPPRKSDLLLRAVHAVATAVPIRLPGLALEVDSQIPVGVGLGSSAAAVVAGLLVGAQLAEEPPSADRLLAIGAGLEGHPENVAAAYLGGLVVAAQAGDRLLTRRVDVPPSLRLVVVTPQLSLSTRRSRAVLPRDYPRQDVVHNLQLVALLVASAFSGDFDPLPEMFSDRLHQPQRAPLVPGLAECLEFRHPELAGVCLSGAGSSVLALARGSAEEIAGLLVDRFQAAGMPARGRVLAVDNLGARGRLAETPG